MMFLICLISILLVSVQGQFEVPDAIVEPLFPKGLRVSIPDQEGIKLFAFHGNINEEFNGREAGQMARDIIKAKNGRWTFYDPTIKLKVGDILYYWLYVDYFDGRVKLGYQKDDQMFVVKELIDNKGSTVRPATSKPSEVTHSSGGGGDHCEDTSTIVNGRRSCAGKLIFNEAFTSTLPNNVWNVENRFASEPDYEFVLYQNNPESLSVNNNILRIKPILTENVYGTGFVTNTQGLDLGRNCTGLAGSGECFLKPDAGFIIPPVISSQINTKNKFSFRYGKIEIRAKLPKGNWIYPELFLNSKNEEYGPGFDSGQMRIAFLEGNEDKSNVLYSGVILGHSAAARNYGMKNIETLASWSNDFHKYTIDWTPNRITVSVDDKVFGNIFAPAGGFVSEKDNLNIQNADRWRTGTEFAPFDREMYITIGVGVGGHNFADRNDDSKPWVNGQRLSQKNFFKALPEITKTWSDASALQVDYIKVWAL